MKLPAMSAIHALNPFERIFYEHKNSMNFFSVKIDLQADTEGLRYRMKDVHASKLTLYGCIRPLGVPVVNQLANHCFLKVVDQEGKMVSSLAFNPKDALLPDFAEADPYARGTKCGLIGEITRVEFGMMKDHFEKCNRKGYWLTTNNCCTCAAEALQVIDRGSAIQSSFFNANYMQGGGKLKVA